MSCVMHAGDVDVADRSVGGSIKLVPSHRESRLLLLMLANITFTMYQTYGNLRSGHTEMVRSTCGNI
jgi:hypothetical protein